MKLIDVPLQNFNNGSQSSDIILEVNNLYKMSTFKELGLNDEILKALIDLGYETPSEIQEKAVPQVISSTQELKAFAQTGKGKTAAFSLPVLQTLMLLAKQHKQSKGSEANAENEASEGRHHIPR